ncbi:MAG TPA: hypothetical protein PKD70_08995 [Saprospiraceae bacterium]|nr:hypothetical protein [Saprospiraceae bacterium]HMP14006.1 hypothetical protein [Saprospiraceae bacterium]
MQIIPARQGAFALRIFASGILKADEKAPLNVRIGGVIEKLPVQEGTFIQQGACVTGRKHKE